MTPELIERLKQSCKLMAEKMPERFEFVERNGAWWFSNNDNNESDFIVYYSDGELHCTQDKIDLLASLLPEPRRFLLCDLIWDLDVSHDVFMGNMIGFYTKTFSMNWVFKYCESMITQKEPLDAKVELFCIEAERQLGE